MTYQFKAYTSDRRVVQGTIEAASEKQAEEALYTSGFQYVLSIHSRRKKPTAEELLPTFFGIRASDIIELSRQIASFIESGISLLTAIQLLEGQATRPAVRRLMGGIVKEIQGGSSFSQAVSHFPDAFPYSYCQVVRASEQAGELETGLKQAAEYLERQKLTTAKIQKALTYPGFIILMAIVVSVLMVTIVLPPMVQLFTSLGVQLPWTTRLVIALSNFFIDYKFQLLLVIIVLIGAIIAFLRTSTGKLTFDKLVLKTPIIGQIFLYKAMGQFCRTSAMLLSAGLPLPQIMDVMVRTISANLIVTQAFIEVKEKLEQGEGFSHPMSENPLFPQVLVKRLAIGEQTGNIDTALTSLSSYFEIQSDQRIQALVSMIEPVLTVVIGLAVVFIMVSIIMPLYSVLGAMR